MDGLHGKSRYKESFQEISVRVQARCDVDLHQISAVAVRKQKNMKVVLKVKLTVLDKGHIRQLKEKDITGNTYVSSLFNHVDGHAIH